MAAGLFRMCFMKNLSAKLFKECIKQQQNLYKIVTVVSRVQCQCYNTTSVLSKAKTRKAPSIRIIKDTKSNVRKVEVWYGMNVTELARSSGRDVNDVLMALTYVTRTEENINYVFPDKFIIHECLKKLGMVPIFIANPNKQQSSDTENKFTDIKSPPPDPSVLIKRRPVVTVMGHVDHGKTTLLDSLRNTAVVKSEFGGITQHIGAFNVVLKSGETITFLDTPGHAAFSSMRLRGAHVTDIVILVVAADDGVMEQTVQSIEMAKSAKVPMIVAINKIDKPAANITRTQNMLAEQGIHLEVLGGDVQSVNISALENINLDLLMEAVLAQAEIMDLKGDPKGKVEGVIIESSTDEGRGKLATVLIKRGTLKRGHCIVSGTAWAKVRAMFDHAGNVVQQASLCDPVQVIGWRELPTAGEEVLQVDSEKIARIVVEERLTEEKKKLSLEHKKVADEKLEKHLVEYKQILKLKRSLGYSYIKKKKPKETEPDDGIAKLNIIIKADVLGSVEAILDTLETYKENKKCHLNVIHYGVGQITETDIELSELFNAIIYCFNIKGSRNLKKDISNKKNIRYFNVIYKLIDDLKEEITKLLPTVVKEDIVGEADVLKEFEINERRKKVKVAGCMCSKGELKKMANYKLVRNNEVIYIGKLKSMRHLKAEVTSVKKGTECGLMLEDPTVSFMPGDKLICFLNRSEPGRLNWNTGF